MLKRIFAIFKKTTPTPTPAPATHLTPFFSYSVVQPGEPNYLVVVIDRQQREVTRYRVWVN